MAVYALTPLLIVVVVGAALLLLRGAGELSDGAALGLGVVGVLVALPFAIAGWRHTAGLVTKMRLAAGVTPPSAGNTGSDAWWMLLPAVGPALYCGLVQSRTNRYWRMEAAVR